MSKYISRENVRLEIAQLRDQLEPIERKASRLRKSIEALEAYLENDIEVPAGHVDAPPPEWLRSAKPSEVILPYLRENPDLTKEATERILGEMGFDFGESNRGRVAGNILTRAKALYREESKEA